MMRRMLALTALFAVGCGTTSTVGFGAREPDPARPVRVHDVRTSTKRLHARVDAETIQVTLESQLACSTVREIPMRQRVDDVRTLDAPVGTTLGLSLATAALAGLGTGLLFLHCNCNDTSDRIAVTTLGTSVLATALVPAAFLVRNAEAARDRHGFAPVRAEHEQTATRPCGTTPAGGQLVALVVDGEQRQARTDTYGSAIFARSALPPHAALAVVRSPGAEDLLVDW